MRLNIKSHLELCLANLGGACISAFALRTYLKHLNKGLDSHEDTVGFELNEKALEHGAVLEKSTVEEAVLRSKGLSTCTELAAFCLQGNFLGEKIVC
jgi:hypothetical protein